MKIVCPTFHLPSRTKANEPNKPASHSFASLKESGDKNKSKWEPKEGGIKRKVPSMDLTCGNKEKKIKVRVRISKYISNDVE